MNERKADTAERHRDKQTETYRQTDRDAYIQARILTDRQTGRHTDIQTNKKKKAGREKRQGQARPGHDRTGQGSTKQRQTVRHTYRQGRTIQAEQHRTEHHTHTVRQATYIHTENTDSQRERGTHTDKADRHTDRQTGRHTDRQSDRQTERQTDKQKYNP